MQALGTDVRDMVWLTRDQLDRLQLLLDEGIINWPQVEQHFKCDRQMVMKLLSSKGISRPTFASGRPVKRVPAVVEERCLELRSRFNTGIHRTRETLANDEDDPVDVSDRTIKKVFDKHNLYIYRVEKKEQKTHLLRFVARFCGQLCIQTFIPGMWNRMPRSNSI
jgi:hypothetical protein